MTTLTDGGFSVLLPLVRHGHHCKALHRVLEANSQVQRNHPHMPLGQWNLRWTRALGLPNYNGVVRVGRVATPYFARHEMGQTGFQKTSIAMACHHAPYIHLQEVAGCLATSKVFILQIVQNVPGVSCPLLAKQ